MLEVVCSNFWRYFQPNLTTRVLKNSRLKKLFLIVMNGPSSKVTYRFHPLKKTKQTKQNAAEQPKHSRKKTKNNSFCSHNRTANSQTVFFYKKKTF